MMTEAVLVALITGGLTLTGTIISIVSVNSKTLYRISQLEENLKELKNELQAKQDKYNAHIERVFRIEKAISVNEEKIKDLESDVQELKARIK